MLQDPACGRHGQGETWGRIVELRSRIPNGGYNCSIPATVLLTLNVVGPGFSARGRLFSLSGIVSWVLLCFWRYFEARFGPSAKRGFVPRYGQGRSHQRRLAGGLTDRQRKPNFFAFGLFFAGQLERASHPRHLCAALKLVGH